MLKFIEGIISGIIVISLNILFFRIISEIIAAILKYIESKEKKGKFK